MRFIATYKFSTSKANIVNLVKDHRTYKSPQTGLKAINRRFNAYLKEHGSAPARMVLSNGLPKVTWSKVLPTNES